ncbi:hypothetical protein Rs2_06949 [Raphanus sativus]|nr:hypothetical protein Rs2_06949 [Raphanus sativus]
MPCFLRPTVKLPQSPSARRSCLPSDAISCLDLLGLLSFRAAEAHIAPLSPALVSGDGGSLNSASSAYVAFFYEGVWCSVDLRESVFAARVFRKMEVVSDEISMCCDDALRCKDDGSESGGF